MWFLGGFQWINLRVYSEFFIIQCTHTYTLSPFSHVWLWSHGCSLPGSSVHGILQARILMLGCHALLQGIFPIQASNLCVLCLLHWQVGPLPLAPRGKPHTTHNSTYFRVCGASFLSFDGVLCTWLLVILESLPWYLHIWGRGLLFQGLHIHFGRESLHQSAQSGVQWVLAGSPHRPAGLALGSLVGRGGFSCSKAGAGMGAGVGLCSALRQGYHLGSLVGSP